MSQSGVIKEKESSNLKEMLSQIQAWHFDAGLLIATVFFLALHVILAYLLVPHFERGPDSFNYTGHPIFWMVPFAFSCYLSLGITLIFSCLYLWKKREVFDRIAFAGVRVGWAFAILTLFVGTTWGMVEWSATWVFEPRVVMTYVILFSYSAILVLRSAIDDQRKKATLSSILGILAFPSVPLSYLMVGALHPSQTTIMGGGLSGTAFGVPTLIVGFIASFCVMFLLVRLFMSLDYISTRVSAARQVLLLKESDV